MRLRRAFVSVVALTLPLVTGFWTAAVADEAAQYGSSNRTASGYGHGIGSTIDVDELFAANYTYTIWRYYWPGITFSNGIFFQTGFGDPGDNNPAFCQDIEYFAWAFDGAGNQILTDNEGCVTLDKHYFTMTRGAAVGNGNYYWQAKVGSMNLGAAIQSAASFPLAYATAVSEISADSTWVGNPRISSVRYDKAVRLMFTDGTWHDEAVAKVYRASGVNVNGTPFSNPCPPYRVGSGSSNTFVTADSGTITCKADGDPLW